MQPIPGCNGGMDLAELAQPVPLLRAEQLDQGMGSSSEKGGVARPGRVVTVLLEAAAIEDDASRDTCAAVHLPDAVPLLDDLSVFDPCLRW